MPSVAPLSARAGPPFTSGSKRAPRARRQRAGKGLRRAVMGLLLVLVLVLVLVLEGLRRPRPTQAYQSTRSGAIDGNLSRTRTRTRTRTTGRTSYIPPLSASFPRQLVLRAADLQEV